MPKSPLAVYLNLPGAVQCRVRRENLIAITGWRFQRRIHSDNAGGRAYLRLCLIEGLIRRGPESGIVKLGMQG